MHYTFALAGNQNSGKTTLFNQLTGSSQHVGNWPGVTVEKKTGAMLHHHHGQQTHLGLPRRFRRAHENGQAVPDKYSDVTIVDLPGIYSLSPYTMEEVVARNVLIDQRPDALLNIIDATNLERNLYLTTQLAELGIPMVVALNMMDVVRKNGDRIDAAKLSNHLGVPVVEISALKGDGVMEAAQRAVQLARSGKKTIPQHRFAGSIEHALAHIEEGVLHDMPEERQRWFAVKIFERDERIIEKLNIPKDKLAHIENDIKACETEMDDDSQSIITAARYTYIASIIDGCVKKSSRGMSTSDKIDRVLTNRILGLPIFAAVMTLVYYIAISTVGGALTDWTNDVFVGEWIVPAAQSFFEGIGCADWLTGLIVDGVISGVGAVLGFVPQMLVLFLLLCILEDCGYMARIAFIMDRVFRRFGLSGKSFIPMLVGTGCGVPGIMASRTIEQERDRRMTIMTTTFIPCGAKMPIVALMAGAMFKIGRIKGIDRPALATLLPVPGRPMLLVDAGANTDCQPKWIVQFAMMGSAYVRRVMNVSDPEVGLLNIGVEAAKGNEQAQAAYALMEKPQPFHFIGNVEARDALAGKADVVAADGFVGNVLLKNTEGVISMIFGLIKGGLMDSTKGKLAALLAKDTFRGIKRSFDSTEIGGAPLLGISKMVIKAHGNSDARAIQNAIRQAKECIENGVIEAIADNLSQLKEQAKEQEEAHHNS